MFICGACKKNTNPGDKAYRAVIETREKVYPERWEERYHNGLRDSVKIDNGGTGTEIVKEIRVGSCCKGMYV